MAGSALFGGWAIESDGLAGNELSGLVTSVTADILMGATKRELGTQFMIEE